MSFFGSKNSPTSPVVRSPVRSDSYSANSKRQWLQLAQERTQELERGQLQSGAISWSLVSSGRLPQSAINLGSDSQSHFLARSFYEGQLCVGRVTLESNGQLKAVVNHKGKEIPVREYEVLVQTVAPPQFSFAVQNQQQETQKQETRKPSSKDLVDIVFVIDDSDSMEGQRWNEVQSALLGITQSCSQVDADGYDLFFLNNDFSQRDILSEQAVLQAFETVGLPDGATPTGARLKQVLDIYTSRIERNRNAKPVSIVVVTDGDPTDNVENVIVAAAKRLQNSQIPPSQLSIHFVQIGDDSDAADTLKYLDDELENKYQIQDIVETTVNHDRRPLTAETLSKVLQTLWEKQAVSAPIVAPKPVNSLGQSPLKSNQYTSARSFGSRKEWIQQSKDLTLGTLTSALNPSSLLPYTWVFVESGVPPSNSIVCGRENEQDTFFARSFYEGQLRYGTIATGASKAVVVGNNGREASVEQYEVLVQASGFFYSFIAGPSAPEPTERTMDVVLIVDDSDSMTTDSRWSQARDALASVAEGSHRFDDDGVDLYFLNSDVYRKNIRTRNDVVQLFNTVSPDGATPTGKRLAAVLEEYIPLVEERSKLGTGKPVNIIVITDGDSTDDVESVIVKAAQRLHKSQVPEHMLGIQFVQIGNDQDATRSLERLDSALEKQHNIRDMVDTTLYDPSHPELTGDVMFKILWGALDRQVDRIGEKFA